MTQLVKPTNCDSGVSAANSEAVSDQTASLAPGGSHRLIIASIGDGGAAVVQALRQLRPSSEAEVAGWLYRAPTILLSAISEEKANKLRTILEQTGILLDVVSMDEHLEPGCGDYEIALAIQDLSQMMAILEETMAILGVSLDSAKKILCASPAVLIGGVSQATVDALSQRFGKLGVELDVSRTQDALFDVAVETSDSTTEAAVFGLFKETNVDFARTSARQMMATGLTIRSAEELWPRLSRTAAKVRVLNRDLQRFDVRLDRAANTQIMRSFLTDEVGMPERLLAKALAHTPFLLCQNVNAQRMRALLQSVRRAGGEASAVLLALQGFSLDITTSGDREAANGWVQAIAGTQAARTFATSGCKHLPGPFTKIQARWLQFELRKHNVTSVLTQY